MGPGLNDDTLPALGDTASPRGVVVIGAGIIGLATALQLRRLGHQVLVLERAGVAAGASRGNAGAFAFSDIEPLASPGILRRLPRWLLDPLGPLALPPAYLPTITPWLWRFWRASTPARVAASTSAQAALMQLAAAATERLLDRLQAQKLVQRSGNLHLYESEAEWRATLPTWQVKAGHGITFSHLHGTRELAALQAGLAPRFVAGTFVPGWMTIDDPHAWVQRIAAAFVAAGGEMARADVQALLPDADGIELSLAGGAVLSARQVVVAAGAWSHHLARTLGHRIPLETERGYNTTLPPGAFALTRQLTFPGHGFVMTPIGGGVRVGGAVELAGLDAPPNWARSDALLAKAQRFVPALAAEGGSRWMGCRPSLPDSLPVIGAAPGEPRVIYAFGHGHLGLTQSAATAELVAALLVRAALPIDVRPFAAERFGSRGTARVT